MLSKYSLVDLGALLYFSLFFQPRLLGYLVALLLLYRLWKDLLPPDDKASQAGSQNWFWRRRFSLLDLLLATYALLALHPDRVKLVVDEIISSRSSSSTGSSRTSSRRKTPPTSTWRGSGGTRGGRRR